MTVANVRVSEPDGDLDLLTPKEVAQWLRLKTPHVVYAAVRARKLPAVRIGETGSIRLRRADVLAWLRPVGTDA